MPIALLYHDVTPIGQDDASGFPGPGAARYKLTPDEFHDHVAALARSVVAPPSLLPGSGWLLTFDDGGASALPPTADMLEVHGWRGHFFLTTDFIDTPTFLSRQQIRELHGRGHVIGTHSCSHPARFSWCSWDQMVREWRESKSVLEDILGVPVNTASVPGGFYSRQVALAAAEAGLQVLFNSEPTSRTRSIDGCLVVGRYTIYRGTSAQSAAALAQGRFWPCLRQGLSWKLKKIAKTVGGSLYPGLRERLLARAYRGTYAASPKL